MRTINKKKITILTSLILVITLLMLTQVSAVAQTIPSWQLSSGVMRNYNNNTYFMELPSANSTAQISLPLSTWLYFYSLDFVGGNLSIAVYDSYSGVNIFTFGFGQTLTTENGTFTNSALFSIFAFNDNTTVSIDGTLYNTSYTATSIIFYGSGEFTYSVAYLYNENTSNIGINLSEIIFLFIFMFIFIAIVWSVVGLNRGYD